LINGEDWDIHILSRRVIVAFFIVGILYLMTNSFLNGSAEIEKEQKKLAMMTPEVKRSYLKQIEIDRQRYEEERKKQDHEFLYGKINPVMICPHCQTKGKVRTTRREKQSELSSIVISLKKHSVTVTQVHCDNCNNTWNI
jgi:hypothetical protein